MREYPSIGYEPVEDYFFAFDKIDGQQIRGEWRRKKDGFWKFGTKTRLLRPEEHPANKAPDLIRERYGGLDGVFKKAGYQKVTCFFEFYGPQTYRGQHDPSDEYEVLLFDCWPESNGGILNPTEFVDLVGEFPRPDLLYRGRNVEELLEAVHEGTLVGLSSEGVVCKVPTPEDVQHPQFFKAKRETWKRDDHG